MTVAPPLRVGLEPAYDRGRYGAWMLDLIGVFGDQYRRYRERVSMLLPLPRSGPRQPAPGASLHGKPTQTHS